MCLSVRCVKRRTSVEKVVCGVYSLLASGSFLGVESLCLTSSASVKEDMRI